LYYLFDNTRNIVTAYCEARHFSILAWHVLNTHIRPITAKWHPVSERGMLSALDTTDEFRAELEALQELLRRFEVLLAHLRDGKPPPARTTSGPNARQSSIIGEMGRSVRWGIPPIQGGIDPSEAETINEEEEKAIQKRRKQYNLKDLEKKNAVGLALSGGGIRSATLCLGVLIALAKRGLLPQFDYFSTVSGGGYLGSFLTAFLNSPEDRITTAPIGLESNELPFLREGGEAEALRHIRHHSKYLASGSVSDRLRMIAAQLYGMVLNGIGVVFLAGVLVLLEYHARAGHWFGKLWTVVIDMLDPLAVAPWMTNLWETPMRLLGVLLAVWAAVALVLIRGGRRRQRIADTGLFVLGGAMLAVLVWSGLDYCHRWFAQDHHWPGWQETLIPILGAIPVISSVLVGSAGQILKYLKLVLGVLSVISAPLFFFGVYLWLYLAAETPWIVPFTVVGAVVYFFVLNINFTSPHRHYRNKLAEAYLIQPAQNPEPAKPFDEAVELKLSKAISNRAPYQLINAALNVPASKNPAPAFSTPPRSS
jgi:hypothetical protein